MSKNITAVNGAAVYYMLLAGHNYPVIAIDVTLDADPSTNEDVYWNAVRSEMVTAVQNMDGNVLVGGYWYSSSESITTNPIAQTLYNTAGDAKMIVSVTDERNCSVKVCTETGDKTISFGGHPFTGYSLYEFSPLYLLLKDGDVSKVLSVNNSIYSGEINCLMPGDPGLSQTQTGVPVGYVHDAGTMRDFGGNYFPFNKYIDMTDYLSDEPIYVDPYKPGGWSTGAGGGGAYSIPSGTVGYPSLPTLSACDSGFVSLYNPTKTQIQALASYFWNTLDLSNLKTIFASPIDAVLGLNIVPIQPTVGTAKTINIGNIATTVSANEITNQYAALDCGTVNVVEQWGSYLDYDGFTKCEIYLPYIGTRELNMEEIMGKTVGVMYHVDVLSGSCVAYIKCGDNVLYNFPGQCSVEIPVTAAKFGSMLSAGLSMATTALQHLGKALSGVVENAKDVATSVFNAGKTSVARSGNVGGSAGIMSIQFPYMIFTYPNQSVAEDQKSFTGYPSNITAQINTLVGYTEVDRVHLTGIPATSAELEEIERIMKEGFIV